ncbi:ParA family protein [Aeromicrobium sp. Root472D3]|uniref:ParA family protein n=1 Tax=Aeromicrobium sp. Root472D3 TaxID=1736540 RepID=UPI0006FA60E4|nr:ParA family protein [Aeromicrobium sp. Root472D3]KQX75047.1 chromosome partitioning protein [Aeromicrobium sp. Root472D3]
MTTTIAVANQKGGVAKTTTVVSLGAALAELGQRVLLVDIDPQGSLTFSLGIDPEDLELTVAQVLLGTQLADDAIVVTDDGMHLLPANITLTQAEESLVGRTGREQRLRVALDKVVDDYDYILIDCPPTLGVLTVGALSAAQQVLIPLQAETLSHRGVGQLLDTIHDVRQFINPKLEIMGVLPTMYDGRTTHARNVLEAIGETYDLPVVLPPIPKTIRFAEAPAIGRSVLSTAKNHKGAEAYREVAAGILAAAGAATGPKGPRSRKRSDSPD